jgi:hypothetical protein
MLDPVEAVRFDRFMSSGKNRPMLLACELSTLQEVDVIAKFANGGDQSGSGGLIREAVSAMLAYDLGLPVPEPYLVEVSQVFIDALENQEAKQLLTNSCRIGFGSRKLPSGYATWTQSSATVPDALTQVALEIFAFDCMATNGDRHHDNSNLLFNGTSFAIIDHEFAFMGDMNLFWKEPWQQGALGNAGAQARHALYKQVRAAACRDLQRFQGALMAITEDRIGQYGEAVPPEWAEMAPGAAERSCEIIIGLRSNAADAVAEVLRALA